MIAAYWWKAKPNFGDVLTHTLLNTFQIPHHWAEPEDAELIVTGSIIEHLPNGWSGTVLGAGKMREKTDPTLRLRRAKILALRGPLTAHNVPGDYALGDPGLLAPYVVDPQYKQYDLGVIPHWTDGELFSRFQYGHLIRPVYGPKWVISEIARCKRVVTTSLHGAIIADAMGVPRIAEPWDNDFKWRDYSASLGDTPHFGDLYSPNLNRIIERQKELVDGIRQIS